MKPALPQSNLLSVLFALGEIPLKYSDRHQALQRIAQLCQQALCSHACTLTLVDFEKRQMTLEAWSGSGERNEVQRTGRCFPLGSPGDSSFLNYDLFAKADVQAYYNLPESGQGVANPRVAARYQLQSMLSCPLKVNGRLLGYLNHFSSSNEPFTDPEEELLRLFAEHAALTIDTIDRFDYQQRLERTLETLNSLSVELVARPSEGRLDEVCKQVCKLLATQACIVWKTDEERKKLRVVAASPNVDEEFYKTEVGYETIRHLLGNRKKRILYLRDVKEPHPYYAHQDLAVKQGWTSLHTAPVNMREKESDCLLGVLDVYTTVARRFEKWEEDFLLEAANLTGLCMRATDELVSRQRLEEFNAILRDMREASDPASLLELLLQRALKFVGAKYGSVSRYNINTGWQEKEYVEGSQSGQEVGALGPRQGVTGLALREGRPIRVDDLRNEQWKNIYVPFSPDKQMLSEVAVPIICQVDAREERSKIVRRPKPMGVLNIESTHLNAFSQADEEMLWSLSQQAAVLIERFETEEKHRKMNEVERQIVSRGDWDGTINLVTNAIQHTLGYEYVNISLVEPENNCIRTRNIVGLPMEEGERFKELAVHLLDSNDIQADIVKSRKIEVPPQDDPRFDREIYERFGHDQYLRVYVPMIGADERVLGSVEAGYRNREHRQHIYEQDVQILRQFVEYAAVALEQRKWAMLGPMRHEFRSPTTGIRNAVADLQRRLGPKSSLSPAVTQRLDTILLNCEMVFRQVEQLEYILGSPWPPLEFKKTDVREIIVQVVKELKPRITGRGLDAGSVHVNHVQGIVLYMDQVRLKQVIYNLLLNSIKYAEDDPRFFAVCVDALETDQYFVIRFRDSGIGIPEGLKDRIFEDGFRAPDAIKKPVSGSGLGLGIARKAVKELGGELELVNCCKPTEFHTLLPKRLKEMPRDDSLH